MRHRPERRRVDGVDPDAALATPPQELGQVGHAEDDHIRLGLPNERNAGEPGETARQTLRVRVIVGQPLDVMLERVEPGRGKDAGLAHGPSEHLAEPVHAVDECATSDDQGSDGGAEPLRETEGDRVEGARPLRDRDPGRHLGVEDPRPIQVETEAHLPRRLCNLPDPLDRKDPPAAPVVRVLHAHEPRPREVVLGRVDGAAQVIRIEQPLLSHQVELNPRERTRRARLEQKQVAPVGRDDCVAGLGVRPDRGLVGHRARGDEDRRLLLEALRRDLLEPVDRGILAVDVVPHLRLRDRRAHRGRGPGDGVAPEVEDLHHRDYSARL